MTHWPKYVFVVLIFFACPQKTFSLDSLQTALRFHQASKFDLALPIFIALSEKFKSKSSNLSNYALCQLKIAEIIRNYGGINTSLQLLEVNQKLMEVKLEVPSVVLSQNFIAKAEAFYLNSNLKEFKSAIMSSIRVKEGLKLPQKYFAEDYLQLARYYLDTPDRIDSCFYWGNKALKLAKSDIQFSVYVLPRIYNTIGYYFHPKSIAYFIGKDDSLKGLFILSRKYYDSTFLSLNNQPLKDELMVSKVYHNLGNSYSNEGNINKALDYYRKSLSVFKKFGSPTDLAIKDWVIGRAFQRSHLNDSAIGQLQKGVVRLLPSFKPSSGKELPPIQPTLNDQWFASLIILKADNFLNRYQQSKNVNDLQSAFDHYLYSLKFNRYLVAKSSNESETINWTHLFGTNAYQAIVVTGFLLDEQTGKKDHLQNAYSLISSSKYSFLNKNVINPKSFALNSRQLLIDEMGIVLHNIKRSIPEIEDKKLSLIMPTIPSMSNSIGSRSDFITQFLDTTSLSHLTTKLVSENSLLIDLYLDVDKLYMITISEKGFHLSLKKLESNFISKVKSLNRNFLKLSPENLASQANEIYKTLLDSVLTASLKKINRLIICPDNALQEIAWGSLVTDTANSKQFKTINYLIKKYAIRTVLNPSQIVSHNLKMSEDFFGIASDFKNSKRFSAIPFSANLVALKAKEFNGKLSTSLRNSVNTRVLHIATHIVPDSVHPYSSTIYLNDDSLTVSEIPNLKIKADLVILNGCQTGKGKYIQSEGAMSVARAFCLLGAKSLVTTLWSVDDKASADLLKNFYDDMENGKELDMALRDAKLTFIEQSNSDELANPFYWSGLQLTGNTRPVVETGHALLAWGWGVLIASLAFIGWRYLRT